MLNCENVKMRVKIISEIDPDSLLISEKLVGITMTEKLIDLLKYIERQL